MRRFVSRIPITKGWSGDEKFKVTDEAGIPCLLRYPAKGDLSVHTDSFEKMKRVEALGVPMCRPIEIGEDNGRVYLLQSWVDGEDAEEACPRLSYEERYACGYEAGEALRAIHTIPAPAEQEPWQERYSRKLDRKLEGYAACPLKYDDDERILALIAGRRHLIESRTEQSYHHGDYHIGNWMLDKDGHVVVIDFNRADYGDPWEEFNRIVWTAQASPAMASGQVDGYFGGEAPEEFWLMLTLYIAANTLSSLYWAIPFGEKEIAVMRRQAAEILGWYDGFRRIVPSWYRSRK